MQQLIVLGLRGALFLLFDLLQRVSSHSSETLFYERQVHGAGVSVIAYLFLTEDMESL